MRKGSSKPPQFFKTSLESIRVGLSRPIGSRSATHLDTFETRDHATEIDIVNDTHSQWPANVRLASEAWEGRDLLIER